MEILAAVVASLTVLVLLNLSLTWAVIRRLRAEAAAREALRPQMRGPRVGDAVPQFTASTIDEEAFTDQDLATGYHVVCLLSTDCQPCQRQVPQLVARADDLRHRDIALKVVVTGADHNGHEMIESLRPAATVVAAPVGAAAISDAFSAGLTPAYFVVGDGVVRGKGLDLDECLAGLSLAKAP